MRRLRARSAPYSAGPEAPWGAGFDGTAAQDTRRNDRQETHEREAKGCGEHGRAGKNAAVVRGQGTDRGISGKVVDQKAVLAMSVDQSRFDRFRSFESRQSRAAETPGSPFEPVILAFWPEPVFRNGRRRAVVDIEVPHEERRRRRKPRLHQHAVGGDGHRVDGQEEGRGAGKSRGDVPQSGAGIESSWMGSFFMPLNIKNDAVDRLARELAEITGESITESIRIALEERLRRQRGRIAPLDLKAELASIRKRCSRLPVLDDREPDVILGYDEHGVPR